VEDTWPAEVKEWVKIQNEDTWCKEMKTKIGGPDVKIPITKDGEYDGKTDFYYLEDEVLKRSSFQTVVKKHDGTQVTLVRTLNQIMVPKLWRNACLFLLHDQLGHPGRERTFDTIKLNYQCKLIAEGLKFQYKNIIEWEDRLIGCMQI
jgi:hypothetical protein